MHTHPTHLLLVGFGLMLRRMSNGGSKAAGDVVDQAQAQAHAR